VLRNRYVADFVVRGILGRRWHVTTGKPERTISLSMLETGYLSAEIETEGATLRGKDIQAEKVLAIGEIRARMLELSKNPPASDSQAALSRFGEELKSFAGVLDAAVPPLVAHELRSHEHSELQFELDRSLSAVPWDLLTAKSGDPLMIGTATARVIVTDSATATPKIQGALSAVVFAADDDVGTTAEWRREQQRIASTLRKAGVRRVSCPSAEQSKEELLDEFAAADVLHLIGHGEIGENGEVSFRVGPNVLLSVAEIRHGLLRANRGPALVFLNACGSVQERTDGGGKVLAGLATPFLEAGSIVVGSFWPVQSASIKHSTQLPVWASHAGVASPQSARDRHTEHCIRLGSHRVRVPVQSVFDVQPTHVLVAVSQIGAVLLPTPLPPHSPFEVQGAPQLCVAGSQTSPVLQLAVVAHSPQRPSTQMGLPLGQSAFT